MPPKSSYRYERKFVVPDREPHQVEALVRLHPALFRPEHVPRDINNIYLDTPSLSSFECHEDGMPVRSKFRIRWYGALEREINDAKLEIKIKNGYVGRKELHPLPSFRFSGHFSRDDLRALVRRSELPEQVRSRLELLRPALVNRYRRSYWRAAGTGLRLTLDTGLHYYPPGPGTTTFGGSYADRRHTIVELKFASDDAPLVSDILRGFPFRLEKFSKYVAGTQRLRGLGD